MFSFIEETIRMELVACEISQGLRASEATIAVRGFDGDQQFLRLERDFLNFEPNSGRYYLTVSLIQKDQSGKFALIELPQEAASGTSRLWVSVSDLKSSIHQESVA